MIRQIALLLGGAIFAVAIPCEVSAQDIDITTMSILTGPCVATLNGADIGCQGKGSITTLGNGKTIVDFGGKDLASFGFAGKLQQFPDNKQELWVDGVYLNQARTAADGQCELNYTKPRVDVTCRAILVDGRKLFSLAKNALIKEETGMASKAMAEPTEEQSCGATLRMHGFLTRAQFQCRFGLYSQDLIDQARMCGQKYALNKEAFIKMILTGFERFDKLEKDEGHKAACEEILRKFPTMIRK